MKLTKAIIAVAGYGTRRLPITKTIEKCMLPIGNRPVVDYLVEDCIHAGITDIIFVVGEQHDQIKQYYSGHNEALDEYLQARGKRQELALVYSIAPQITFHYVVQDRHQPYGTAVPMALCADKIDDDEHVLYVAGDDFIYNPGGPSGIEQLINALKDTDDATSGMLSIEVPREDVSRYGVIELRDGAFVRIVEKPSAAEAPSNLINISKYVLDKDMVNHATTVLGRPAENGECQITDAFNMYMGEGKKVIVVPASGEYLDGGNLHGWVYANNRIVGYGVTAD